MLEGAKEAQEEPTARNMARRVMVFSFASTFSSVVVSITFLNLAVSVDS
jgi:hypothetical protein